LPWLVWRTFSLQPTKMVLGASSLVDPNVGVSAS
jgi:hypothetical protein